MLLRWVCLINLRTLLEFKMNNDATTRLLQQAEAANRAREKLGRQAGVRRQAGILGSKMNPISAAAKGATALGLFGKVAGKMMGGKMGEKIGALAGTGIGGLTGGLIGRKRGIQAGQDAGLTESEAKQLMARNRWNPGVASDIMGSVGTLAPMFEQMSNQDNSPYGGGGLSGSYSPGYYSSLTGTTKGVSGGYDGSGGIKAPIRSR